MPFESLVWIVPIAVAAAGVWRPRYGLYALAACLPLFGAPPGGPYLGAFDAAAAAAIATCLLRPGRGADPSPLTAPALAFLVVSAASFLPLAYRPPSWRPEVLLQLAQALPYAQSGSLLYTWRALLNLALGLGLYFSVRRALAGRSVGPLGRALAAGLAGALLLGLAEHAGLLDLSGYRAKNWARHGTRLHSLFFHAAWFAEYLVLAVPIAVAALLERRRGRPVAATLAVAAVIAVAFTEQRGAWLTALAQLGGLGLLLARRRSGDRRHRARAAGVAAFVAGLALALSAAVIALRPAAVESLWQRASDPTFNLSGRFRLARTATVMTSERPLLGWGIGAFAPAYDMHHPRGTRWAVETRATPHNLYLSLAAERGLLGLAALLLLMATVARALRQIDDPLGDGFVVMFVGLAVYGCAQYILYLKALEWLFWVLLGGLAVHHARSETSSPATGVRTRTAALTLAAVAIAALPFRAVAEPPTGDGDRSFGWHEAEADHARSWRWIEGRAAVRVHPAGTVLALPIANGHPHGNGHPVTVTVYLDGRRLGSVEAPDRWRNYRFPIEPAWQGGDTAVLTIEARPTFRPFSDYRRDPDLPRSSDIRCLGVAIGEPMWRSTAADRHRFMGPRRDRDGG